MKLNCPECGKRHNKFPRTCYHASMNDNTHAVIARLASHGTSEQQQWAKDAAFKWKAMQDYIKHNGWVEPGSTLEEKTHGNVKGHAETNTLSAWPDIIMGKKNT
jgi:hypothetical protein